MWRMIKYYLTDINIFILEFGGKINNLESGRMEKW